ncbi:unnamed protein product [Rotaria sordida]|uniref:Co-chaperone DjlA N-terminal domain-containing protein n=1 Tax=Rotaria sordida TaxID=392033 RepID=A0A815JL71_9BILA|nr:unnamed protein product [Rotaria sordida]CAF1616084.1 unnamed protein product [Rotaria sordida]
MSSSLTARDKRIAEWWWQDLVGFSGQRPNHKCSHVYMKTLIDIAAADGVLHEKELKYVLGMASVGGQDEHLIKELEAYRPGTSIDTQKMFNDTDTAYVASTRPSLVYFAHRAASADGELHPKELEAIHAVAKKLGSSDEEIQKILLVFFYSMEFPTNIFIEQYNKNLINREM